MTTAQDVVTTSNGAVCLFSDGDGTVVQLAGEIDLALADGLDLVAAQAVERGDPIRIDVSAVTFLDSTALGLFARLAAGEHQVGRRLSVVGAHRLVLDTLDCAGLTAVLDISSG
jgi:anti-anti-sigma factor